MCPVIASISRLTGEQHIKRGRPPKLTVEQRLLATILFLRKVVKSILLPNFNSI